MRIITIVGIDKSGKTSTVTALAAAIRRRRKRVGTCKTILSPTFSMSGIIDAAARHRRAGSELVCTRAQFETAFLHPEALPLSKILEQYRGCDYVLLQGDDYAPVPRIVCAKLKEDALPRINSRTFAISGEISRMDDIDLPLPCFDALHDADALLDHIDKTIPDIFPCSLLDTPLPPAAGVMGDAFCQCGCHAAAQQDEEDVLVLVGGKTLTLTKEQRETLLGWAAEAQDA